MLSYTLVLLVGVTQAIHTWRVMQLPMTLITNNMNDNSVISCTQEVWEMKVFTKPGSVQVRILGLREAMRHTQWRCLTVEMGENRYIPCLFECGVLCSHMGVTCKSHAGLLSLLGVHCGQYWLPLGVVPLPK